MRGRARAAATAEAMIRFDFFTSSVLFSAGPVNLSGGLETVARPGRARGHLDRASALSTQILRRAVRSDCHNGVKSERGGALLARPLAGEAGPAGGERRHTREPARPAGRSH